MYVKEVTVKNSVGLYARPATYFIQKANEFKSSIWVEKEDRRVNAKSLLGILSLGIMGDTTIKIIADGIDEQEVERLGERWIGISRCDAIVSVEEEIDKLFAGENDFFQGNSLEENKALMQMLHEWKVEYQKNCR